MIARVRDGGIEQAEGVLHVVFIHDLTDRPEVGDDDFGAFLPEIREGYRRFKGRIGVRVGPHEILRDVSGRSDLLHRVILAFIALQDMRP